MFVNVIYYIVNRISCFVKIQHTNIFFYLNDVTYFVLVRDFALTTAEEVAGLTSMRLIRFTFDSFYTACHTFLNFFLNLLLYLVPVLRLDLDVEKCI